MMAESPASADRETTAPDLPSVWARKPRPEAKPARRGRLVLVLMGTGVVALGLLWIAAHRIPAVGSKVADGLRAVIGVEAVTALEDFMYGLQDRATLAWRGEDAPKAYWNVPDFEVPASMKVKDCELPTFRPKDVGPVHADFEAPGDGKWVPLDDRIDPEAPPRMYKTLLHPDARRSWAAVSVVAIDLRQVALHLMAGRHEPEASTEAGQRAERPGLIPASHQRVLLAAFNGGFKAEHSHWGMMVDGVTLLPARKNKGCIIGRQSRGDVVIGPSDRVIAQASDMTWWRQAPDCMVTDGALHEGLRSDDNTYWGATLNGETVIRRSAIGISADGKTLYSGIGDHTTARAMALAMKHAGAASVAQLDVNWSYPKFVVYRSRSDGQPVATKLCDGFKFSPDEYVREVAPRDFFYLTRRDDDAIEARVCGR